MANKNTKRSQNTCPQCGAPLNRNSFVLECPYCGYVDVGDIETGRYDNEADEGRFYKYVEKQWPYITQVSHAKASQQGEAFSIQSEHPYFANNGEYQLIPDFSLRLSATIHSTKLNLSMEASSDRGLPNASFAYPMSTLSECARLVICRLSPIVPPIILCAMNSWYIIVGSTT